MKQLVLVYTRRSKFQCFKNPRTLLWKGCMQYPCFIKPTNTFQQIEQITFCSVWTESGALLTWTFSFCEKRNYISHWMCVNMCGMSPTVTVCPSNTTTCTASTLLVTFHYFKEMEHVYSSLVIFDDYWLTSFPEPFCTRVGLIHLVND